MKLPGSDAEPLSPLLQKLMSAQQAAGRAPSSAETGTRSPFVEDAGHDQWNRSASVWSEGGVELLPPLLIHQHAAISDCPAGADLGGSDCDLSPFIENSVQSVLSPSDRFLRGWEGAIEGQADAMSPSANRLVDLAWPEHRPATARVAKDASRLEPVSVPNAPPVTVLWDETMVPGTGPRAIPKSFTAAKPPAAGKSLPAAPADDHTATKRRSGSEWLVGGLVLLMIVLRLTPGRTSPTE